MIFKKEEIKYRELNLEKGKKIYFVSDMHFGMPNTEKSKQREKAFVHWLSEIKNNCGVLIICGDMFDFWFEWKRAIPKGFTRLLGKIAEFKDDGIEVLFFKGNHDMWITDYFETELEISVYHFPCEIKIGDKLLFVGHGDGLGPGDHGFKLMRWLFRNKTAQWLFRNLVHPDWAIALAKKLSRGSRAANQDADKVYLGDDKEWINIFCINTLKDKHYDYFVLGHRHIPLSIPLSEKSTYINLGDWLTEFTYAEFDGETIELKRVNANI